MRAAFPDEAIVFFAARTHLVELKKQVCASLAESISWLEILPPDRKLTYFRRLFCEIKMIRRLLGTFPQDSRGHLLFTSVCSSTVVALKLATRAKFEGIRTQVILHGGLSGVIGKRYRHPIRRFQEMRTALTLFGNNNIQYLTLEESIRDALLNHVPALSGKIEELDHPLPPNESGSTTNDLTTPIRFGFLGLANQLKGFPVFVQLAKEMQAKYQDQAEFHALGRLPADENITTGMSALKTKPGVMRMSRAAFIQGIKPLHFIVFPHQPGHYELSPSGTLLDAIAWEKPLIARRIPIFESVFKKYGDIGYLFDSDRELRDIVQQIVQKVDKSHYHRQVFNVRKARAARTSEALAASYREICRKSESAVRRDHTAS